MLTAGYKTQDSPHVYFSRGPTFDPLYCSLYWLDSSGDRQLNSELSILNYNPLQKNFSWSIVPLWCSTDPVYFAYSLNVVLVK